MVLFYSVAIFIVLKALQPAVPPSVLCLCDADKLTRDKLQLVLINTVSYINE
jgi:hypothetical protein